ncbi:MAG: Gx transporter family protein [Bacilli bacterium]|nr:Gx transporter family protein [Bacilli bacterium]
MKIRKITTIAMFISLSVVLSVIEGMIPLIGSIIPGIKLGLANIVILVALYILDFKDACYISIGRVFIVGLIRTGLFSIGFFLSLGGAISSIIFMYLFKKFSPLSVVGVSVIGSVFHCLGQIGMAIILLKTTSIIFYLPIILILSIPTGLVIGYVAKNVLRFYESNPNVL